MFERDCGLETDSDKKDFLSGCFNLVLRVVASVVSDSFLPPPQLV
jgi:hypothetical protein